MTVTQITMANNEIKIIQLPAEDALKLLALVKNEAAHSFLYDHYWSDIARQISINLAAQADGKFFQCAACTSGEK